MPDVNLDTTNLLLGIMAAVSVIQALLLVAAGIIGWKLYKESMQTLRDIEERQIAPLRARVETLMGTVDGILVDVKHVTTSVNVQTERVNAAFRATIDGVDETADRVKHSMSGRVARIVDMVQGARTAVGTLFNGHTRGAVREGRTAIRSS